jgi:hypothetical protein
MDNQPSERKTKFQQLCEEYEQYLTENGFPQLAPIAPAAGANASAGTAATSATSATSAVDTAINTDPNVLNAKKKAAAAVALALKQRQGTITNP